MIGNLLDQVEASMARSSGHMAFHWGSLSPAGSIFNAVVSGIILVGGVVGLITAFDPFFILFVALGIAMHSMFVMIAVRVHTGRTLYDRQLLADLEEEERERAD